MLDHHGLTMKSCHVFTLMFSALLTTTAMAQMQFPSVPQNQMGAVAVVMGEIILTPGGWLDATVQVIDDKTARIDGDVLDIGHTAEVVKLSDCKYQAIESGRTVATLDLSVLGSQYEQGQYGSSALPYYALIIFGTGESPALCYMQTGCFNNLTLGFRGQVSNGHTVARALRALQFLQQQYCPPARIGF